MKLQPVKWRNPPMTRNWSESPTEYKLLPARPPCKFNLCQMSALSEVTTTVFRSTIMSMLTSLLTLSIKTSLLFFSDDLLQRLHMMTHNSSRHRMGAPIAARDVNKKKDHFDCVRNVYLPT